MNPLRDALAESVDFERLRAADTAALFVSATNVWTGKLAVFERGDLTLDHVMASACLPTVFKAVEIGGVPHWDGGYLGNPALYPLHRGARTRDILLVQINPVERRETPRTSEAIQDRLNEIGFNANLMRELRAIDFVDGLIAEGQLDAATFEPVLVHRIDGTGELDDHAASTRLDARWRKHRGTARPRPQRRRGLAGQTLRGRGPARARWTSRPPISDGQGLRARATSRGPRPRWIGEATAGRPATPARWPNVPGLRRSARAGVDGAA